MSALLQDLRHALRLLHHAPGFTAVVVLTLALGICANTTIFSVVHAFLLRPLPYANADRLVSLQSRSRAAGADLGVNFLDFRDWREDSRTLGELAFFNLRWNGNVELPGGGGTETLKTTFTTWNLFSLLGVRPLLGRDFVAADDEPGAAKTVLISHRLWQTAFGGERSVVGRQLRLDDTSRTVVGVLPADFRFPVQTDLWVPMGATFAKSTDRTWRADQAIARLAPGVTFAQAQAELSVIAQRLSDRHPDSNRDVGAAVLPLRAATTGAVRPSLFLLLGACGGLMLIACANASQLLLARALTRRRELAVRAALGASRARIAGSVLAESTLLALAGAGGGILLAAWAVGGLVHFIPVELPFWVKIELNPGALLFAVTLALAAGVLASAAPVWQALRADPLHALKEGGGGTHARGTRTRLALTTVQVALSLVLLVGAGLLLRSLTELGAVAPGFDPRGVLLVEINPTYRSEESSQTRIDRFSRLLERIAALPGVEAAAANNSPPFVPQRPWNRSPLTAEGQSPEDQRGNPLANFQTVSPDYFRALRIPLQRGRVFAAQDALSAPRVCVVSAGLARRVWPDADPLGKRLQIGDPASTRGSVNNDPWMTVVGVVGDVRHQALDGQPGPDLYFCSQQLAWKQTHFLIRARADGPGWRQPLGLLPAVRGEVAAAAPDVGVFHGVALEREIADSLWQPRLRGWLLGFFSAAALGLAALGLHGALAYLVTQRTREIGIRMALGASRERVARLVLGESLRAVGWGLAAGGLGALGVSRALHGVLYGVGPGDPLTFAAAAGLLLAVAALASWVPARCAAGVDPAVALRNE